jgi:hypothetical protein
MMPWLILLLSITLLSASCGRSKGGGIVDNGNHVPSPRTNDPSNSQLVATNLEIFESFVISVPGPGWNAEAKFNESRVITVSRENDQIVFTLDSEAECEGLRTETEYESIVIECSENDTLIIMPDSSRIFANHRDRSVIIQSILRSIRMK